MKSNNLGGRFKFVNILVCLFLLLTTFNSFSQKNVDTRVIVTVPDTLGLSEKVKMAFVNEGIMVVDNKRTDTISTYPFNIKSTSYILVYASIKNNTVTIWGYYAYANKNLLGITVNPSNIDYKKIFYFKRDKYWQKLKMIASRLSGTISYGKEN